MAPSKNKSSFPLAAGSKFESQVEKLSRAFFDKLFEYEGAFREDSLEWSFDFEATTIRLQSFVDHYAVAKVQVIGTYCLKKHKWIWGCDDDEFPETAAKSSAKTKKMLVAGGLDLLNESPVKCMAGDAHAILTLAWKWDKSECPLWLANNDSPKVIFVTLNEIEILE